MRSLFLSLLVLTGCYPVASGNNADVSLALATGCGVSPSAPLITNLNFWIRADYFCLGDGGTISSWPDSSGNHFDLADKSAGGSSPLFYSNQINGRPVIRFKNSSLSTSSASGMSIGFGFFLLAKRNASGNGINQLANFDDGNPFASKAELIYFSAADQFAVDDPFIAAPLITSNLTFTTATNTGFHLLTVTSDGTGPPYRATLFIDGTQDKTNTTNDGGFMTNGTYITVGSNNKQGEMFDGDIAEMMYFNRTMLPSEVNLAECYFSAKYALAIGHACP